MLASRVFYQAEKACQGQTLQLISRSFNDEEEKFHPIVRCQSGPLFTCLLLGHYTRLKRLARDKRSSLFAGDEDKTFYKISVDLASLMQTVLPNVRRAGTPFVERSRFSHETQGKKYVCLTVGTLYIIPAQYQICIIKGDSQIGHIEVMKLRVKNDVCLTMGITLNQSCT